MSDSRYRFHGSNQPARRSVLNTVEPAEVDEAGVVTFQLYDPIDSWGGEWGVSAKEFTAALSLLDADAVNKIQVHINSPGGEVFEAVTIINALRRFDARVVAVVDGLAASAASVLAAAADELVMAPNSTLMIHDAWGVCVGPATDMRSMADLLDKLSDNIADVYAAKAGGSAADWRERCGPKLGIRLMRPWRPGWLTVSRPVGRLSLRRVSICRSTNRHRSPDRRPRFGMGRQRWRRPVTGSTARRSVESPS